VTKSVDEFDVTMKVEQRSTPGQQSAEAVNDDAGKSKLTNVADISINANDFNGLSPRHETVFVKQSPSLTSKPERRTAAKFSISSLLATDTAISSTIDATTGSENPSELATSKGNSAIQSVRPFAESWYPWLSTRGVNMPPGVEALFSKCRRVSAVQFLKRLQLQYSLISN
jgi:hypothetical protein